MTKSDAKQMREAAAQVAAKVDTKIVTDFDAKNTAVLTGNHIAKLIRALPLPAPAPDPRDEALRIARDALAWVEPAMRCLGWLEADYEEPFDDSHELGKIDESREAPSFRIKVGHLRKLEAALAALNAIKGGDGA